MMCLVLAMSGTSALLSWMDRHSQSRLAGSLPAGRHSWLGDKQTELAGSGAPGVLPVGHSVTASALPVGLPEGRPEPASWLRQFDSDGELTPSIGDAVLPRFPGRTLQLAAHAGDP